VLLTAKVEFPYAGVSLRVGERFEAPADHARLLIAIGRAVETEHSMAPIESGAIADSGPPPKKPRRYKRRDMQAES